MKSLPLAAPGRFALVVLACLLTTSPASAGVVFESSFGTGFTAGNATRNSDGAAVNFTEQPGSIIVGGNSAGGGTGGGIDDAGIQVATLSLNASGSTTQLRGPGGPEYQVIFNVLGRANFLRPDDYAGSIRCSVLLNFPIAITISDAGAWYTGTHTLLNLSGGADAAPNSIIEPGSYRIFAGTNLSMSASNLNPTGAIDFNFFGRFVVPAPSAAGLALIGLAAARRRR